MGSKREELVVFSILGTAPAGQMSLYLQCEDKRYCLMLYIKYEIHDKIFIEISESEKIDKSSIH